MYLKTLFLPKCLYVKKLRPTCRNRVLLTFDDGPHPETTPRVLELLRHYDARAIFFVVGSRIHRAAEMLPQIIDEGHLLGNHTYSHWLDRRPGFRDYKTDLLRCESVIREHTSIAPRFHRPPSGSISLATAFAPKSIGLRTILWSVEGRDWSLRDSEEAVWRATKLVDEVRPQDIICLHDEDAHSAELLQSLLPRLHRRGLQFDVDFEEAL